ncbi:Protein CBG25643 [Caenorhabditis briggsae]|uniref:Protein CBG25643 n=1 Tax=Caenorhabditis briggsae TaxID=6238 RepID=B6IFC7_CAEBR|nr:Protein CBG25643 [Caenorhabditis briggsae]CAR98607.1 Protein CBG25643 [Caenorhabditis briggsae]
MVVETSSWKMDALSFLDNYYPAPRDSQPSVKIAPSFFGDVKEPIVVVGSPGIGVSVQTTLTGPIHLCPFKESVELFRKQLQIQKTVGCQTDIAGYRPVLPLELVLQEWRLEVLSQPIDREIRRLEACVINEFRQIIRIFQAEIAGLQAGRRRARNVIFYRVQRETQFPIAFITREMFNSLSPQTQARHLAQIFRRIMY